MSRLAYHEYAPPPALAGSVECIWTVRSEAPLAEPLLNRVLPDGCLAEEIGVREPADNLIIFAQFASSAD